MDESNTGTKTDPCKHEKKAGGNDVIWCVSCGEDFPSRRPMDWDSPDVVVSEDDGEY